MSVGGSFMCCNLTMMSVVRECKDLKWLPYHAEYMLQGSMGSLEPVSVWIVLCMTPPY